MAVEVDMLVDPLESVDGAVARVEGTLLLLVVVELAPAELAPQAQLVLLVKMAPPAVMANLVDLVMMEPQGSRPAKLNNRAAAVGVIRARLERREPQGTQELLETPEPPAKAVVRLHLDPPDQLDLPDPTVIPDNPAAPANLVAPVNLPKAPTVKDLPAHKAHLGNPVSQVALGKAVHHLLGLLAQRETKDPLDQPVAMATLVLRVMTALVVVVELVTIVPLPALLQAIK
jgi:hypothetical protein